MGSRADFKLKYLIFLAAGKSDLHFWGALRVHSMFPVLLYDLSGWQDQSRLRHTELGRNGMRRHAQLSLIKREFSNNLSRHCQELFPVFSP